MRKSKWIWLLSVLMAALLLLPACGDKKDKKKEEAAFSYINADLSEYITLGRYKELSFTYEMVPITQEDVDEYIAYVLEDFAEYKDYEEVTEGQLTVEHDYITIDYIGYMDGKTSSNTTGVDQVVLLDKENNGFIPGFIDDLFGIPVGETVETNCVFPENYGHEEYAGKEITFYIKVKSIVGHYYPATLTDELVAENTEFKTAEEYRAYVFEALTENAKSEASSNLTYDVWEVLESESTLLKYPEQPVQDYYDSYMEMVNSYAAEAGYEDPIEFMEKELELTEEDVMTDAKMSVFDDLIVFAIAQVEKLTVTDEEYNEFVAEVAESNSTTVEAIEEEYTKEYLSECALYNKALDVIFDSVVVNYTEK